MHGDYSLSHPGRLLCGLLDPYYLVFFIKFICNEKIKWDIMVVDFSPHELCVVLLFPGFDAQSQVYGA